MTGKLNSLTLAALAFIALMVFNLLSEPQEPAAASAVPLQENTPSSGEIPPPAEDPQEAQLDTLTVRWPYDQFTLTQGPHGQSYGHLAVDLSAGKGAAVLSPINGVVSDLFIDQYGNTTLIIENEIWQVLMLHGNYSVKVGEQVAIGQQVGAESNNGYTVDWLGRSCRGRDCGYHTHMNLFDKRSGANVNPLEVIE